MLSKKLSNLKIETVDSKKSDPVRLSSLYSLGTKQKISHKCHIEGISENVRLKQIENIESVKLKVLILSQKHQMSADRLAGLPPKQAQSLKVQISTFRIDTFDSHQTDAFCSLSVVLAALFINFGSEKTNIHLVLFLNFKGGVLFAPIWSRPC